MTEIESLRSLLRDAFGRTAELVQAITDDLSPEMAAYRPDQDANPIGWLIWHASRVEDDHIADLAGTEQLWPAWRERFGLPFDDWATGYGQTSEEVGQVRVSGDLLNGYFQDVHRATLAYIDRLTTEELERVVDSHWDPPVTASVRLVSVVDDVTQHLGQASYVQGLAERAGVS